MIEAHTVDSWTRLASRGSTAYGYAVILAGFAAPLFLWLAGLSIPLRRRCRCPARVVEARGGRRRHPPRARDLHPRVSVPSAGVHHQPRRPSGDAVSRRHPEHHGTGHRRGRPGVAAVRVDDRARRRLLGPGNGGDDGDADREDARRSSMRCRSGCSGMCGRPATTRRSRRFPGLGLSSPAPRWVCCSRPFEDTRAERRLLTAVGIAGALDHCRGLLQPRLVRRSTPSRRSGRRHRPISRSAPAS